MQLFGDSRWTEYVRCGDSRAMERCVVSEWLANLVDAHAPKDCYGYDKIAQDRLVIQREIARLSAASTWPPSLTMDGSGDHIF